MIKPAYEYHQVCLVPKYNNVQSRLTPEVGTWLTRKSRISMPIIPANMESVISPELARVIVKYGGVPLFHRFADLETKKQWILEFPGCFISTGVRDKEYQETIQLVRHHGLKGVVIDVAHAHDKRVMKMVDVLKKTGLVQVIVGSVCTPMAYQDLANAGADAIRVGIGSGSACITRDVTACGIPQFSAVHECAEVANQLRVPLIADGGITEPRSAILALAAGASSVIMGQEFARCKEAAAEKMTYNTGATMAVYRGQASKAFQEDYYGEVREGTVPEGVEKSIQVTKTAAELIDTYLASLRSAMTYCGSKTIEELQRKAEFRVKC